MKKISIVALAFMLFAFACKKEPSTQRKATITFPEDNLLRVNQIQLFASHNSYRIRTTDTVLRFLNTIKSFLPSNLDPTDLDYTHENFDVQMSNYGIRGLEIDIYNDPQGGDFYNRQINNMIGYPAESGIQELKKPGFKVLHIKDIDYNTHYLTLKQSLQAVKRWSDMHPSHLPLFINIETKFDAPGDNSTLATLGFQKAIPYDASSADKIDQEFKEVFGESLDKVMTPDKLRGDLAKLNDVVTQNAWPSLGSCRGKIFFIMQGDMYSFYKQNHANLSGRVMFTYEDAPNNEAVFIIKNNPKTQNRDISNYVSDGYIVRTRSDEFTEARTGDYSRLDAALTGGAQIVTTDYYKADPRGGIDPNWSTYSVSFPNKELARKNPVNATTVNFEGSLSE